MPEDQLSLTREVPQSKPRVRTLLSSIMDRVIIGEFLAMFILGVMRGILVEYCLGLLLGGGLFYSVYMLCTRTPPEEDHFTAP